MGAGRSRISAGVKIALTAYIAVSRGLLAWQNLLCSNARSSNARRNSESIGYFRFLVLFSFHSFKVVLW